MPRTPPTLKAKALQYLAQREHSRLELRQKLLRHARRLHDAQASLQTGGYDAAPEANPDAAGPGHDIEHELDALLDWLQQRDLLSAERFIETRLHARMGRFGNRRITHELARHGLSADAQAEHLLRDTELQRARDVWLKRFGAPAGSATERARQLRFLAARGFSAEVVRQVVAGAGKDDADVD